ncbi:YkgJ family cysteine cluster protein [Burkholderia gladioli]|uniref:YkgJ family cysteine cluster protein n=1 Tax=Burkholderia gladioli TaxID=28095 RepID=UPI00164165E8|nr:YkgJ family cysteine cluster protein [Burkholderia gladioli]
MQAKEAIPILNRAISKLESKEPSWKNCRSCPFSGKCCDGAKLRIFPEERINILEFIKKNPNVRNYSVDRYMNGKACYFYNRDAKACLIHDVRPLNCRWTPYTIFIGDAGVSGMIRDSQCNFRRIDRSDGVSGVDGELIRMSVSSESENQNYILWQKIEELRPLMKRNEEMIPMEEVMKMAITL